MTILLSVTRAPAAAPRARLVRPYRARVHPRPLSPLPPVGEAEAVDEALQRRVRAAVATLMDLLTGRLSLAAADWLVDEDVHAALLSLRPEFADRRIALRALRVQSPADGVVEAGAVVALDGRIRGLALRYREAGDTLVCAALEATPRVSSRPPGVRGTA